MLDIFRFFIYNMVCRWLNNITEAIMIDINRENVQEHNTHQFSADASDLRWPPGYAPEQLTTNLGNGFDFFQTGWDGVKWTYTQIGGCITLTVYND